MTKKKKIIFSVLAILLILYFLPIFGLEKTMIKNKIAKNTREPVLGKNPIRTVIKNIAVNKEINFVDDKNISHYITDENISKLKKENSDVIILENLDYSDISSSEIKKLMDDDKYSYYDFMSKGGEVIFFKPNFTELFKKKTGDKVKIIFDNIEYEGYIIDDIEEYRKLGMDYDYSYRIKYSLETCENDDYDCINSLNKDEIDIQGFKNGTFYGSIKYTNTNGGTEYRIESNKNLGILIPSFEYELFLGPIKD